MTDGPSTTPARISPTTRGWPSRANTWPRSCASEMSRNSRSVKDPNSAADIAVLGRRRERPLGYNAHRRFPTISTLPVGNRWVVTGSTMARETPFDSIESAYEFMSVLREALDEAYAEIQTDTDTAQRTAGAERRVQALQLVDLKLNQLRQHLLASLIILNDLRTLRRLLLGGRAGSAPAADS